MCEEVIQRTFTINILNFGEIDRVICVSEFIFTFINDIESEY